MIFGWFKKKKRCELCNNDLADGSFSFQLNGQGWATSWKICSECADLLQKFDEHLGKVKKKRVKSKSI